jgi:hypothetical protein
MRPEIDPAKTKRTDGQNPDVIEPTRAEVDRREREHADRADRAEIAARERDRAEVDRRERDGAAMQQGARTSWQDIKSRFVDDPAGALAAAEQLVHAAVEDKLRAIKGEANAICARESGEEASSTEGMRTRLIRYQDYCERLARSPQ